MLSLVADYDTTSSSSSEEDDSNNTVIEKNQSEKYSSILAKPLLLPSANFLLSGANSKPPGEVFNNPFLEAEKLEIHKLQKHVKMVELENHLMQKNGRKICWNNRKGRCRFGNKCKYAHDSDLAKADEVDVKKEIVIKEDETSATTKLYSFGSQSTEQDDTIDSNKKFITRKRHGLGNSIVPGKRVMKTYKKTKKKPVIV